MMENSIREHDKSLARLETSMACVRDDMREIKELIKEQGISVSTHVQQDFERFKEVWVELVILQGQVATTKKVVGFAGFLVMAVIAALQVYLR